MTRNVFVLGCDRFNLDQIKSARAAEGCRFHALTTYDEAKAGDEIPAEKLLEKARARLDAFDGSIDAILGWWDFPVSTLLPILRREYGTPGPTLESTLRCEHKYWSRLEQSRSVPDHIPAFRLFDPDDPDPWADLDLQHPFWIKPVKSVGSYLGFRIEDRDDFDAALAVIRQQIHRMAVPFDQVLSYADLPDEIAVADGRHCVAESIISDGRQVTLEGYVHDGEVHVYGVIASIREGRHGSSFARYQYPSDVPNEVAEAMTDVVRRFLTHVGFGPSPFNAEFYWNEETDRIWMLEVNTRISKSHAPLFQMVDGEYHHAVNLQLALGEAPELPKGEGRFAVAAKFMPRRFEDAVVTRVPTEEDVAGVQRTYPGTLVEVHVHEGMRLSELKGQDSYSYMLAEIHMGADDEETLLANYDDAMEMLGFAFDEKETA